MASLQQVVEQLASVAAKGTNNTCGPDAGFAASASMRIQLMASAFKMFFSTSALYDWAVLLFIASLFENARRLLTLLWDGLINAFFVTAVFEEHDVSFQWVVHWLSKQPSWKEVRNVQISTSNFDLDGDDYEELNSQSRKVTYVPAMSQSYTLWYKYRWMGITRSINATHGGWLAKETLTMCIMSRDRGVLAEILQDAKRGYVAAQNDQIAIYVSNQFRGSDGGWKELATRPKRPLNSIILDPGITDLVVEDVRDFLDSKEWYAERGIPFRRGYLLYGAPGSGKTSLIHSIAGELGLNVYIISLSRAGLDDTSLAELISALPERCIALMEDIDAAFHHGLSRETQAASTQMSDDSDSASTSPDPDMQPRSPPVPTGNRVSLSGLLNALDGIAAQEGRVLFATTNKYHSLDPALCRPGRMDLHVEFKLASRFQAEQLFKRFYPATAGETESKHTTTSKKRENGSDNGSEASLIDLSESHTPPSSSPPSPSPPPPSFPSSLPSSPSPSFVEKRVESANDPLRSVPTYVGVVHSKRAPALFHEQVDTLASQFALAVPERQLSMASLQGFLMMHKTSPFEAVGNVGAWVEKELSERQGTDKEQ